MFELANLYYKIYLGLKLVLVLVGLVYLYKGINRINKPYLKYFYFISILIVCVVADLGDYWTYYSWYEGYEDAHIEPIWYFFKTIIPNSYDLFRAVVWGIGLLLYVRIFKMYKIDLNLILCLFAIFYIDGYNYARAAVALVFIVLGFSLFYSNDSLLKKRLSRIIVLIVCVALGIAMHRSMIIIIPALVGALFINVTKKTLYLLLLLFPVFSILLNQTSTYFTNYIFESELFGNTASTYLLSNDQRNTILSSLIRRLPTLLLYAVSFYYLRRYNVRQNSIDAAATAAFLILYTAFLLSTINSIYTIVPFYRTLSMAYPFMLITIAYTLKNINNMKMLSLICVLIVLVELLLTIRIYYLVPDIVDKQINERFL